MIVQFETLTPGGDDTTALDALSMLRVPMKGEIIIFRGEQYGGDSLDGEKMTMFEVVAVRWEIDCYESSAHDVSATCFLRLHEQDVQANNFVPRCMCKETNRMEPETDTPTLCGNCNRIAWWRKR